MRKFLAAFVAAAALSSAATLVAQEDADRFAKLDANKDGFVSADEVEAEGKTLFERLVRIADKDGDKKLSKEEFEAGLKPQDAPRQPLGGAEAERRGRAGQPGAGLPNPREMFGRMDANKDGKLSKDELPERLQQGFVRLDADSDGALSQEEFGRAAAAFGRRPGAPGFEGPPRLPVMATLDADQNGELSATEIEGAAKALLKLDKNNDGKLTRDELLPPDAPRPEGRRPDRPGDAEAIRERLRRADANGDGKLSKEEAPERLKENFDRLDANSDGSLDANELREAFQGRAGAQRPEEGRPGRRRPEGDASPPSRD